MIWQRLDVINSIRSCISETVSRGQVLAEDVVDPTTGEILAEAGTKVDTGTGRSDSECRSSVCMDCRRKRRNVKGSFQYDGRSCRLSWTSIRKEVGVTELVYYPVLAEILEENDRDRGY